MTKAEFMQMAARDMYLAALCANMAGVPLAQVQLWLHSR